MKEPAKLELTFRASDERIFVLAFGEPRYVERTGHGEHVVFAVWDTGERGVGTVLANLASRSRFTPFHGWRNCHDSLGMTPRLYAAPGDGTGVMRQITSTAARNPYVVMNLATGEPTPSWAVTFRAFREAFLAVEEALANASAPFTVAVKDFHGFSSVHEGGPDGRMIAAFYDEAGPRLAEEFAEILRARGEV